MKRAAIIAPTGMLGSMVYNILKDKYELILVYRDPVKLGLLNKIYGGVNKHKKVLFDISSIIDEWKDGAGKTVSRQKLINQIGEADAVINCAGIIPHRTENPLLTFFLNAVWPHILSDIYNKKLIHISTDCVFNGRKGAPFNEKSQKTAADLYGFSKASGEPAEKSLVLRTSLIGPEIANYVSLLEWLKKQNGTVSGYVNHYWNGITNKQFAFVCDAIISNRKKYPASGLFHIFSTSLSKYQILVKFKKKYRVPVIIKPYKASTGIDRRLGTVYNLNKKLKIPSFDQMLENL